MGLNLQKLLIDSHILSALAELVAGIFVIRLLVAAVRRVLEKSRLEKAAHSLVLSIVKAGLIILLGLMIASRLGVDITGAVALASVLTLAISLSLQNMLTNVFGGFTVLTNHPFHSGDYVDIGGQAGTVEEISMTYTRLATPDNKIILIPNGTVATAQIINYSAAPTRRVELTVSASYDAPTRKVIDTLLEAAADEKILPEPAPFAGVSEYGDSAITYVLRFWVNSPDYWDTYYRVNQRIGVCFQENGVEMTYPHLIVHTDKD